MTFYISIVFCVATRFLEGVGGDARGLLETADFGGVGTTGPLLLLCRIRIEGFLNGRKLLKNRPRVHPVVGKRCLQGQLDFPLGKTIILSVTRKKNVVCGPNTR